MGFLHISLHLIIQIYAQLSNKHAVEGFSADPKLDLL